MRIAPRKESFLSRAIKQGVGGRRRGIRMKYGKNLITLHCATSRSLSLRSLQAKRGTSLYRVSIALLYARMKVGRK